MGESHEELTGATRDITLTGYRLTVLYGAPSDPAAFDSHYLNIHVPLTLQVPGIEAFVYGKLSSLDPTQAPPYYFAATIFTKDAASFASMLSTPEARAAIADVPNYATGGATFLVGAEDAVVPGAQIAGTLRKLAQGRLTAHFQRLVVLYGQPLDPEAFDAHYEDVHVPLTLAVPGIHLFNYGRLSSFDPAQPSPYYFYASIFAADAPSLQTMLATPQAQAAVADVPNYATGGATFLAGEATLVIPRSSRTE